MTKNLKSESDNPKSSNAQLEYFGNLSKLELLEGRVKQYDVMFPFIVPKSIDKYNTVSPSPGNAPQWGSKENDLTLFNFFTFFTLDDTNLYKVNFY